MLYVFGQSFSGFIVGSMVTNAPTLLYPFYAAAPRVWGLSPMDDQKVGGLTMWVVGGTYLLGVFSAIFFAWAHAEGVHDDVAIPVRRLKPRPVPARSQADEAAPASGPSIAAAVGSTPAVAPSTTPTTSPRRIVGSPTDLGARHVVTSAPDRSRLN